MSKDTVQPKEVVLFSGGMDSYITYRLLGKPDTIYVKLNHKYQKEELSRVSLLAPETKIINMEFLGQFEEADATLPLRNLYLAMVAVNLGYDNIWLTIQKDEMSIPDRTLDFLSKTSQLLSTLSGRTIIVDTMFEKHDKADMVKMYFESGYSVDELNLTWACYKPNEGVACGNCPACFRRYVAFKENDLDPGFELKSDIKNYYYSRLEQYSLSRIQRMTKYVK